MRDVRDVDVTFKTYTDTYRGSSPGALSLYSSSLSLSGTRKSLRSQRAEILTTVPAYSGRYYLPTDYTAFYSRVHCPSGSNLWSPVEWVSSGGGYYRAYGRSWTGSSAVVYNLGCNAVSLEPAVPAFVIASARNKVLEQIASNDLNVGQFFGELKESVGTIASILRDVVALFRTLRHPIGALRSVRLKDVRRVHNRVAREYLRFMYGIKPMMADAYAAADAIRRGIVDQPIGYAYGEGIDPDFRTDNYPALSFPKIANVDLLEGFLKRGVEVSVHYRISDPTAYQLNRYGLANPLSLAWELATLSFVVDWFTGIGSFLTGLTAGFGLTYDVGYETRYVRGNFTSLQEMKRTGSTTLIRGERYARAEVQLTSMRRYANPGFTPPPVYLRVDLNLSRALSSIALFSAMSNR